MEVALAHTVYTLAVGITNFIAEHDDKDAVTEEISSIVTQIQNITDPLSSRKTTNLPLEQCLQNLEKVLSNTHERMRLWKESRFHRLLAFINPSMVTQQLKDSLGQLMNQYTLLMGALLIVDHVKGYNLITPVTPPPPTVKKKTVKGKSNDVLDFWEKCIGKESGSVKGPYLCKQLSSWMGTKLNMVATQRLLLRLDNNNTGYVSLATLQDLVQNGNMKEIINLYSADPTLPLLIWIDDDVLGNAPKALNARKAGITVVQIGSTSAAKTWFLINREFLKKHNSPSDIRIISDQVRTEFSPEGVSFRNWKAGEEMTKFIREEGISVPILIYTGTKSLKRTRYVEKYKMVGSMAGNREKLQRYIDALAARRKDDIEWVKYGGSES